MLEGLANNASGSVTDVSEEGLASRLLDSLVGVLLGVALFFGSFLVLWWNEGNVIAEKAALTDMSKALVKTSALAPDRKLEGKLVYAAARLSAEAALGDPPYVKPGPYLVLERNVEMYQWIEKADRRSSRGLGGGQRTQTTYSYALGWASGFNDSAQFHNQANHANPPPAVQARAVKVARSRFGKLDGAAVLDHVASRNTVPLTPQILAGPAGASQKALLRNGMLYLRGGAAADQLGDLRLSYKAVRPGTYSVIAQQAGKSFVPYHAKNGRDRFLVEAGDKPPKEMIQAEKASAGSLAMILRVVGFFCMWIGLNLLAGPLTTLLDVVPFLGTASRFLLAAVFFVASLALTLVTVVVAMIAHHPAVLVLCMVAAGAGYYYHRQKRAGAAGGPAGADDAAKTATTAEAAGEPAAAQHKAA